MAQLVTRIDEELLAAVDALVEEGVVASRSEAVRRALQELLDLRRRRQTAESIVAGYTRLPQTEDEIGWRDEATARMIADEPW
jgi:metal-responsive CopG/Arc/MetJ family transcriptional regulator